MMPQTQGLPPVEHAPIVFTIPLMPKAQMRSRSKAILLKNKATGQAIMKNGKPVYTAMNHKAPEQDKNEETMMQIVTRYAPEVPFDCPIIVGLKVYLPVPHAKPAWWKEAALAGYIRPTIRPDFDNFQKEFLDVLTQACFWRDDSLVVGLTHDSGKYYAEKPRWEVSVIPQWYPKSKKEWEAFRNVTVKTTVITDAFGTFAHKLGVQS